MKDEPREISAHYPWHIRNQLLKAGRNMKMIDALTDALVGLGLARPRSDGSKFASKFASVRAPKAPDATAQR